MFLTAIVTMVAVASYSAGAASASTPSSLPTSSQNGDGGVCYHTFVSDWICPDSSQRQFLFPQQYVQTMELSITTRRGQRRTITMGGDVDAIFLTPSATEKFLLSYYWAIDRDKANRLHRALAQVPTR